MFQVLYRIPFNGSAYEEDWMALNGMVPLPMNKTPTTLSVESYLTGPAELPPATERGWKDIVQTPPGYVTVIRIRWVPKMRELVVLMHLKLALTSTLLTRQSDLDTYGIATSLIMKTMK
jgi:hypothetical protein